MGEHKTSHLHLFHRLAQSIGTCLTPRSAKRPCAKHTCGSPCSSSSFTVSWPNLVYLTTRIAVQRRIVHCVRASMRFLHLMKYLEPNFPHPHNLYACDLRFLSRNFSMALNRYYILASPKLVWRLEYVLRDQQLLTLGSGRHKSNDHNVDRIVSSSRITFA